MNHQPISKNQLSSEKFQKYPKNFQQNKHYRSVKQKLMTAEDDQDIIKFPFTTTSLETRKSSKDYTPPTTTRKVQKYKGKKFQTVPMRTISYSSPLNLAKNEQLRQCSKTSRKSESENKFTSKNIFTNMKKLKDLRKTNYKSKISSMLKGQNKEKENNSNENNLDLFKLTSTNFHYRDKMFSDCEEIELLRKLTQTQGTSRNVIKFQKHQKQEQKDQIEQDDEFLELNRDKKDTEYQFFVLHPVKTEQTNSVDKAKPKKLSQAASSQNFVSKDRFSDGAINKFMDKETLNQQHTNSFVRYSQSTIDAQNQILRNGLTKLRQINKLRNQNPYKKSDFEHIPHSLRATFRVKHIEDNKNILLNTIKKKATTMDRNQLVEYLKKVVK